MAFHVFNLSAEAPNQVFISDSDEPESVVGLIFDDILPESEQDSACENDDEQDCLRYNDTEYCDDVVIIRPESAVLDLIFCSTIAPILDWNDIELSAFYPPPRC